jgi:hypothetical protein
MIDISIMTVVTLDVDRELVAPWLNDLAISSAMLHVAGAVRRFAPEIVLLKWGMVDAFDHRLQKFAVDT